MSATNAIAYTLETLVLITAIAIGVNVLLRRHTGTRPGRLSRCSGIALAWRWVLRRERRRAREREFRLLSYAQAQIITTWLVGENPRRSNEVRDILHTLGTAAFDAHLIGAWDKLTRPTSSKTRVASIGSACRKAETGRTAEPQYALGRSPSSIRRWPPHAADPPPDRVDELADRNQTPVVQQQRGECRACCGEPRSSPTSSRQALGSQ